MSHHDDPRDSSLEAKFTLPKTWHREAAGDLVSTSGMFMGGLIMVTRNRFLAWPAVVLGINGLINQHPMRMKEGGSGPWTTVILAVCALIASYAPLLTITPVAQRPPVA